MYQSNKRVLAHNTMLLYVRTIVMMVISLYTSRVVLEALGEVDFGIYNIVGGVVLLFAFVSGAMVSATQRFLSYELGCGGEFNKVFSISVIAHLSIALLSLAVGESLGLWFMNCYINIPADRLVAAQWVYQFTLLSSCFTFLRIPYQAVIIAHERMDFYAYISILEAVLKLAVVYMLLVMGGDKLTLYALLTAAAIGVIFVVYIIYCVVQFPAARFRWQWDGVVYRRLMSFSGWSLLGSGASVGAQQGVAILVNIFFGVVANSAMGIATQVNSAVYSFIANFQTAFNPQIVKTYAASNLDEHRGLILLSSRYSFLLLYLISLPVILCAEPLLGLWLGEVPPHTVLFTQWMLALMLTEALVAPLWMSVQAVGRIRDYQIFMALILALNIPIIYLLYSLGFGAEWALIVRFGVGVVAYLARLWYLRRLVGLSLVSYFMQVVLRCSAVVGLSLPIPCVLYLYCGISALVVIPLALLCVALASLYVGMGRSERSAVFAEIARRVRSIG